ncbi:MAG: hypothetical protein IPK26_24315 [Planctomycetes bacterium]|nr:hypothetical protein [Planctomycetota bacterium]
MNETLVDVARRLVQRAFVADFRRVQADERERQELSAAQVAAPRAQDYAAWRRAVAWVAAVLLALGTLLAIVDHEPAARTLARAMAGAQQPGVALADQELAAMQEQVETMIGRGNLEVIDDLTLFQMTVKIAVVVLLVLAARGYARVRRSQWATRIAFVVALGLPLLASVVPWTGSMDFTALERQGGNGQALKTMFGNMLGVSILLTLGPKLLSLLPGVMRSSLTMKTLLPEASAPGWLTVVFAPLYAGFLALTVCVLSQIGGDFWLLGGFAALVAAPCVYLRHARNLVRPHTVDELATVVHDIRRTALLWNGLGLALLVVFVVRFDQMPLLTASHLLLEALGNVLLTMVVFSDVILPLLKIDHEQTKAFQASALREVYEARLAELGAAGLLDAGQAFALKAPAAPPGPPPPV